MKKLLLFILAFSLSFTSFSQEDGDYKWLLGASSGMNYTSGDGYDYGMMMVDALYSVTDDFMLGAVVGVSLGDAEGEVTYAKARYSFGSVFVEGMYDLGDTEEGLTFGLGYGWDLADNVEFAPRLGYNSEWEEIRFGIGFAIRM